jgi:hypothetical protein
MKPAALICIIAALASATPIAGATGRSAYDGAWSLNFVTQRGGLRSDLQFRRQYIQWNCEPPQSRQV